MRKEFELSDEDYAYLIAACQPVPYMIIGGVEPASPQENANTAWRRIGSQKGFNGMTVEPVSGKCSRFFTAEVVE